MASSLLVAASRWRLPSPWRKDFDETLDKPVPVTSNFSSFFLSPFVPLTTEVGTNDFIRHFYLSEISYGTVFPNSRLMILRRVIYQRRCLSCMTSLVMLAQWVQIIFAWTAWVTWETRRKGKLQLRCLDVAVWKTLDAAIYIHCRIPSFRIAISSFLFNGEKTVG